MQKLDIDKLIAAIRELAAESPDNIYDRGQSHACSYVVGECSNGTQGCIVGQALRRLGLETPDFKEPVDDYLFNHYDCGRVDDVSRTLWLIAVQTEQDSSNTWAYAVEDADESNPLN